MSNQPQQKRESIRVRSINFLREINVGDLKFKSQLCATSHDLQRRKLSIEYVPQLRHHAISMQLSEEGKDKRMATFYVPDSAVASWEPLVE